MEDKPLRIYLDSIFSMILFIFNNAEFYDRMDLDSLRLFEQMKKGCEEAMKTMRG